MCIVCSKWHYLLIRNNDISYPVVKEDVLFLVIVNDTVRNTDNKYKSNKNKSQCLTCSGIKPTTYDPLRERMHATEACGTYVSYEDEEEVEKEYINVRIGLKEEK